MAFETVCRTDEVPEGGVIRCKAGDRPVALFRLEDGFYATAARCPHAMGALFRGKVTTQGHVVCPLHRAEFDIRTGKAMKWANFPPGIAQLINLFRKKRDVATYPVRVEGEQVQIEV